jgi:hypothetical protein
MVFTPLFAEAGESQFVDKLMVVVHRDMKLSLDYFDRLEHGGNLVDNLPDFAVMARGKPSEFTFPLLNLAVERMSSSETENGEWLSQDLTVGAGMIVEDITVAAVHRKAEKYARAFKAVLRRDIVECLPAASATVDYTLDIDDQYFEHGTKGTKFTQPVQFVIKVRFGEK